MLGSSAVRGGGEESRNLDTKHFSELRVYLNGRARCQYFQELLLINTELLDAAGAAIRNTPFVNFQSDIFNGHCGTFKLKRARRSAASVLPASKQRGLECRVVLNKYDKKCEN